MLLRWMMEGKIIVGTVDLLTVLMIVLLSLDGRLVAPGGARSSMPKKGWSERSAGRQCIVLPLQLCIKTFTVLVGIWKTASRNSSWTFSPTARALTGWPPINCDYGFRRSPIY
jgi:hypothetical protein